MKIHKNTRLTPIQRKKMASEYYDRSNNISIIDLGKKYGVSRPTVYKVLDRARNNDYIPHKSNNKRFQCLKYGIKRLAKIESQLEKKLKIKARRYNKSYPGEMIHFDTKRLPWLKGENKKTSKAEYIFVAIDDYSRELFVGILPDKTQYSAESFLKQVIDECAYTIECAYSDNGLEYKGNENKHAFMKLCKENEIGQRFTKVCRPQTNGKAERVIRTLMDAWHNKIEFKNREHRKKELIRFVNYYNNVKPHKGIEGLTPMEKLINYFYSDKLLKV